MPGLQGAGSSQAQCLTSSCRAVTQVGRLFWEVWPWETAVSLQREQEHFLGGWCFQNAHSLFPNAWVLPQSRQEVWPGVVSASALSNQRGSGPWPSSLSYGRWASHAI